MVPVPLLQFPPMLIGPGCDTRNARKTKIRRRRKRRFRFTRVKNERAKRARARASKAAHSVHLGKRAGTSNCIKTRVPRIRKATTTDKRRHVREGSSNSVEVATRILRSRTLEIIVPKVTRVKRYRSLAPEPEEGLTRAVHERDILPSPVPFEDNPMALAPSSTFRFDGLFGSDDDVASEMNGEEEHEVVPDAEVGRSDFDSVEEQTKENSDVEAMILPTHEAQQGALLQAQDEGPDHNSPYAGHTTDWSEADINIPASAFDACRQEGRVSNGGNRRRGHRRTNNAFFGEPRQPRGNSSSCSSEESEPLPEIRIYDRRPFINQALQRHETTIAHDRILRPEDSLYWFDG